MSTEKKVAKNLVDPLIVKGFIEEGGLDESESNIIEKLASSINSKDAEIFFNYITESLQEAPTLIEPTGDDVEGTFEQIPLRETKVLVIGLTGSGKSSLLNGLLGDKIFDSTSSSKPSESKLFTPYCAQIKSEDDSYLLKVCDTRGLNDPSIRDEDILGAIQGLYSSEFNLVNYIIVCFKMDRLRTSMHTSIKVMIDYIMQNDYRRSNVIIALTHADGTNEVAIHEFMGEMMQDKTVGPLFKMAKYIIKTTLPDLSNLDKDFKQIFMKRRRPIIEYYLRLCAKPPKEIRLFSHDQYIMTIELLKKQHQIIIELGEKIKINEEQLKKVESKKEKDIQILKEQLKKEKDQVDELKHRPCLIM